ncbi:glycosyltransferase family A protein [Methylobacterium oryzihabitans]|uniref:Glycosyltransferase family 2 protein n=1 Tax=Methylobacterium oryzihabitans TaxID=2499852 RepID=A0A3S2W7Z8_9HYPH|nr:glycosyltransferase family A protein [Methylobacterium oryzihabitans]RVU15980.1 glycosyltransferase family 2 protein [Methylobacterium oryzihabitans]
MTEITLSVCVTTGRRPAFLDGLLTRLAAEIRPGVPFEVVVSDAGEDDAARRIVERHAAAGLPVVHLRHAGPVDGPAHLVDALHRGRGRYLVALADDALLDPQGLAETIAFLDGAPEVLAAYAPPNFHDDTTGRSAGPLHRLDGDAVFATGDALDLLGFLVRHGLRPDHAVFRAEAVRRILSPGAACHWSLVALSRIVAAGAVAFRARPFLRLVTRSGVAEARGRDLVEEQWDLDRGGLEYLVQGLLAQIGAQLDAGQRQVFRDAVDAYVQSRLRLALRQWQALGDFVRTHEILCRLRAMAAGPVPEIEAEIENPERLPLLVAVQTLARFANGLAGVNRLVLVGVADGPSLSSLLRELGLDRRILVTPPVAGAPAVNGSSLVFLADEAERQRFLDQGYAPGLIVSERDLVGGPA